MAAIEDLSENSEDDGDGRHGEQDFHYSQPAI
jgi:hypothetical protein